MSQVNYSTKKTNCQHLNETERQIIERQLALGTPKKQIARLLGRNISTIRREIKRGSVKQRKTKNYISNRADDPGYTESTCYFADVGQRRYEQNRLHCGRKYRLTECSDFVKFAACEKFESIGFKVYYAHPYSAWERGQNEHFNGMLRRFLPKGSDLSVLTQDDLDCFAEHLNSLPRKHLNYFAPKDLFF